jgi:hypothetical protein
LYCSPKPTKIYIKKEEERKKARKEEEGEWEGGRKGGRKENMQRLFSKERICAKKLISIFNLTNDHSINQDSIFCLSMFSSSSSSSSSSSASSSSSSSSSSSFCLHVYTLFGPLPPFPFFWKQGLHHIAQADLKLTVLLLQLLRCWDYRGVQPYLALFISLRKNILTSNVCEYI